MSVETTSSLRITRVIRADRQRVWEAWTRPEEMKRWCCPQPGGVKSVTSDFRVGGAFTLAMHVDGSAHTAFGTYQEIDEPHRLVYTWDWRETDNAMGETRVTVEFLDRGEETEVVLVHEGFPAVEARQGHQEGWSACLDHLQALFA